MLDPETLIGNYIRLEPLDFRHAEGLANASASDIPLYQWSPVPQGIGDINTYIQTALNWQLAGTSLPFAVIRKNDDSVIGSTRFFNIEQWAWPADHPRNGRLYPDVGEIGYTWLASSSIRTGANTEAKLLLLTLAFEKWSVYRICFHADMRNTRSRTAIERLGAKFEGTLRSHRLAIDNIPRNSARFSILDSEWPEVKQRLLSLRR